MYVCLYVCVYVCMYVCTYVCLYVCVYVCMYVCIYVCFVWVYVDGVYGSFFHLLAQGLPVEEVGRGGPSSVQETPLHCSTKKGGLRPIWER